MARVADGFRRLMRLEKFMLLAPLGLGVADEGPGSPRPPESPRL
jgi:hypothetical protein